MDVRLGYLLHVSMTEYQVFKKIPGDVENKEPEEKSCLFILFLKIRVTKVS